LAIHLAVFESNFFISLATFIAFFLKISFLFPICLKAQFTAFLTKFRSSKDDFFIISKKSSKTTFSNSIFLLAAKAAIKENAILFSNSFFLFAHLKHLETAPL
jgi:predicted neuraminidase